MEEQFKKLDKDGDGMLTFEEFKGRPERWAEAVPECSRRSLPASPAPLSSTHLPPPPKRVSWLEWLVTNQLLGNEPMKKDEILG